MREREIEKPVPCHDLTAYPRLLVTGFDLLGVQRSEIPSRDRQQPSRSVAFWVSFSRARGTQTNCWNYNDFCHKLFIHFIFIGDVFFYYFLHFCDLLTRSSYSELPNFMSASLESITGSNNPWAASTLKLDMQWQRLEFSIELSIFSILFSHRNTDVKHKDWSAHLGSILSSIHVV